jgi:hypothetical protein
MPKKTKSKAKGSCRMLPVMHPDAAGDFGDPLHSLPAAKKEFYDATLVDLIVKCMKSSATIFVPRRRPT